MNFETDLIYDVGMHNGDDTAYYLHKGFRVVAIDANPAMVRHAERRFAAEIEAGRLRVLQIGIAAEPGEADFYVSTELDKWSSFDPAIASRGDRPYEIVRVPCLPFGEILARHGLPYYIKIDIEGADRLCLDGLNPDITPPYISVEMCHEHGNDDIERLCELGYTRFLCIRQNDLKPIRSSNIERQLRLRRLRAGGAWSAFYVRGLRRLTRELRPARDADWKFPEGSSGTFGERWPGPWLARDELIRIWRALHDIDAELGAGGLNEWFDIHAAR